MKKDFLIIFLEEASNIMNENRDYLIRLDSVVGDGDLGLTMGDGYEAAYETVKEMDETDVGKILYQAGKAMSVKVPSTMGTLMASGFMQAGKALKGKETLEVSDIVELFAAYEQGVQNRGKAQIGDKTFLDGLHPAVEALRMSVEKGESFQEAADQAAKAAQEGFHATTAMLAKHGRAAARGEASKELEDPGAAVAMLLMKAFSLTVEKSVS